MSVLNKKNILSKSIKYVSNNNIMLTIATILLLLACTLFYISRVEADTTSNYVKSFTTIEISYGDTLTSIAEEYALSPADYNEYIDEVMSINNLHSDTIHYGCYLLIPVYERDLN